MTDSLYNTFVTLLLIIAAVIIFVLLGRWLMGGGNVARIGTTASAIPQQQYVYQPTSSVEVFRNRPVMEPSSTSYTYIPSTSYESSSYSQSSTTYSYTCDGMGHCWTNQ